MGKKKREVLEKEFEGFSEGMKANGFSAEAIKALWDTVLPFADYAFNKSHAAGYGLVSYWTAYLKANYPAEYMAGLLTSVGDDKDKAAVYLADCRKLGITVLPPDVNESGLNFASVGEDIRYGLGAVRNVGVNVVASLIDSRTDKGKFIDFSDYLNKIDIGPCNKKVTESLIKAGAFDSLGHPRKGLFLVHTDAVDSVLGTKKAEAMGQFDLFGGGRHRHRRGVHHQGARRGVGRQAQAGTGAGDAGPVRVRSSAQRGGPPAGRPGRHRRSRRSSTATSPTTPRCGSAASWPAVNRRVNKNGMPWASAQLEDLTGGIEVMFFPHTYSTFGAEIADDAVVLVERQGARSRTTGSRLIANDLVVPDFSQCRRWTGRWR